MVATCSHSGMAKRRQELVPKESTTDSVSGCLFFNRVPGVDLPRGLHQAAPRGSAFIAEGAKVVVRWHVNGAHKGR